MDNQKQYFDQTEVNTLEKSKKIIIVILIVIGIIVTVYFWFLKISQGPVNRMGEVSYIILEDSTGLTEGKKLNNELAQILSKYDKDRNNTIYITNMDNSEGEEGCNIFRFYDDNDESLYYLKYNDSDNSLYLMVLYDDNYYYLINNKKALNYVQKTLATIKIENTVENLIDSIENKINEMEKQENIEEVINQAKEKINELKEQGKEVIDEENIDSNIDKAAEKISKLKR